MGTMHMTCAPTVPESLSTRASTEPHATALIVAGNGSITYGSWDRRSNSFARGLLARGVQPGDRIGLLFGDAWWIDYTVAYLGVLKAGAVAVPISGTQASSHVGQLLEHCGAVGVCASVPFSPRSGQWVSDPAGIEAGQGEDQFRASVDAEHLAQILYTSGTTGTPKGVAFSHGSLVERVPPQALLEVMRRSSIAFHGLPIGVTTSQNMFLRALRCFARMVIMPGFEPEGFCRLIAAHRPSFVILVPAMALLILNTGAFQRHDLSSVTRVALTGAPAAPDLLRRLSEALPSANIANNYCLTESAGTSIVYDGTRPTSVGRPAEEGGVLIVDDEGKSLSPGEVGEVWIRRAGGAGRFYYGDPESTAETFLDRWTRTGDLGYLGDAGYLYLTGRKQETITSGGHKVSAIEIENALYEHPAVAEAAVFGIPHGILGEDVAAGVVLRAPASAREIKSFVRQRLSERAMPRRILFLDVLPRNVAGKVVKTHLRELWAAQPRPESVEPRTETEIALTAIWKDVLGLDQMGVTHDFTDLGGYSLAAAQIAARIEQVLGVEIRPAVVYEEECVAGLALVVDSLAKPVSRP